MVGNDAARLFQRSCLKPKVNINPPTSCTFYCTSRTLQNARHRVCHWSASGYMLTSSRDFRRTFGALPQYSVLVAFLWGEGEFVFQSTSEHLSLSLSLFRFGCWLTDYVPMKEQIQSTLTWDYLKTEWPNVTNALHSQSHEKMDIRVKMSISTQGRKNSSILSRFDSTWHNNRTLAIVNIHRTLT